MSGYSIKRFLLDIVYPNRCPFCGEVIAHDEYYCCLGAPELTLTEPDSGDLFILFEYNEQILPFIYAVKENGDGYAIAAAAKLLCERIPAGIDLITCIPANSARLKERGYNPPGLIAREMSAISGVPYDVNMLIKTRRTKAQKLLSAAERRENLRGLFILRENMNIKGKCVLLVDDVRTTGATLTEAASVLLAAGAARVYSAVVAAVSEPEPQLVTGEDTTHSLLTEMQPTGHKSTH
jgi:ComF family protein